MYVFTQIYIYICICIYMYICMYRKQYGILLIPTTGGAGGCILAPQCRAREPAEVRLNEAVVTEA